MIILGYVYSPRAGAPGGAYSIRPYTGTRLNKPTGRKAPTHKQFEGASADGPCRGREAGRVLKTPVPDAPRPRKVSKRAAERFRRVGKLQNTPLNISEASEGSKHVAERFRGLGAAAAAGEVWPGTKLSSLPRKGPSRMPTKLAGYQENFAGGRSRPAATPQIGLSVYICRHHLRTHQ